MKKIIATDKAPAAIGPYSQALEVNGLIEGQNITEQTHRVCKNLEAVLTAAGSSLKKTVKTVCFLSNMADFTAFNQVYAQYFTEKPARSCVAVKDLPKGALVEVEVIAEKE